MLSKQTGQLEHHKITDDAEYTGQIEHDKISHVELVSLNITRYHSCWIYWSVWTSQDHSCWIYWSVEYHKITHAEYTGQFEHQITHAENTGQFEHHKITHAEYTGQFEHHKITNAEYTDQFEHQITHAEYTGQFEPHKITHDRHKLVWIWQDHSCWTHFLYPLQLTSFMAHTSFVLYGPHMIFVSLWPTHDLFVSFMDHIWSFYNILHDSHMICLCPYGPHMIFFCPLWTTYDLFIISSMTHTWCFVSFNGPHMIFL